MIANKIPVPDPIAPSRSAKTLSKPIQMPPDTAAIGIYLENTLVKESYLFPKIVKC